MLTPKERFLKSPHAKAHYELCATEAFQAAVEAAFAQTAGEYAFTKQENKVENFMFGAAAFMHHLMHLAEVQKPSIPTRDPHNLKHE